MHNLYIRFRFRSVLFLLCVAYLFNVYIFQISASRFSAALLGGSSTSRCVNPGCLHGPVLAGRFQEAEEKFLQARMARACQDK